MLVTQSFDVSESIREGENELLVHITTACIAARGKKMSAANNALKYDYESLRIRKAASMFGWDIMPRMVSGGIWRPVYIENRPIEHIRQSYLMTTAADPPEERAELSFFYEVSVDGDDLSEYNISVKGRCGESTFEMSDRLWYTAGKLFAGLDGAKLWWPKGYGEQPLYDVEVVLSHKDRILDTLYYTKRNRFRKTHGLRSPVKIMGH